MIMTSRPTSHRVATDNNQRVMTMSTVKVSRMAMIVATVGMIFGSSVSACVVRDRSERIVSYPVRVGGPPPRYPAYHQRPAWADAERYEWFRPHPRDEHRWAERQDRDGHDRGGHGHRDHSGDRDDG